MMEILKFNLRNHLTILTFIESHWEKQESPTLSWFQDEFSTSEAGHFEHPPSFPVGFMG